MKTNTIIWIIYLSGFLLSYLFIKFFVRTKKHNTWEDVKYTFLISLFSYIAFIIITCFYIKEIIEKTKDFWNKDAPKWL